MKIEVMLPAVAAGALWATLSAAQFAGPTLCTGEMEFHNDDGTFGSYRLSMAFDGAAYTIRAVNLDLDEETEDSGRCPDYLTTGCRHSFPPAEGGLPGYYDFSLESRGEGRYFYSETWSDGFSGSAMLDCRRAAERP